MYDGQIIWEIIGRDNSGVEVPGERCNGIVDMIDEILHEAVLECTIVTSILFIIIV